MLIRSATREKISKRKKINKSPLSCFIQNSLRQWCNWGCHQTTPFFFSSLWISLLVSFLCTERVICLSWPQNAAALLWQRVITRMNLLSVSFCGEEEKQRRVFFVPAVINLINILIMNKGLWSDGHESRRYFGEVWDKSLFVKRQIGFRRPVISSRRTRSYHRARHSAPHFLSVVIKWRGFLIASGPL